MVSVSAKKVKKKISCLCTFNTVQDVKDAILVIYGKQNFVMNYYVFSWYVLTQVRRVDGVKDSSVNLKNWLLMVG